MSAFDDSAADIADASDGARDSRPAPRGARSHGIAPASIASRDTSMAETLSDLLQATAVSFAAAREVMHTAARTAFTFFADASEADRAALMNELSESALVHNAILAGYANALDAGGTGSATAKDLGYRNIADLLQHELGRRKSDADTIIRLGEILRDGTYPALAQPRLPLIRSYRYRFGQAHVGWSRNPSLPTTDVTPSLLSNSMGVTSRAPTNSGWWVTTMIWVCTLA